MVSSATALYGVQNILLCNYRFSKVLLIWYLGKGLFSARMNQLGHMQQGGSPTPFDRNMGTKMAAKSVQWIVQTLKRCTKDDGSIVADGDDTAVLMGVIKRQYQFSPLSELKKGTNFE